MSVINEAVAGHTVNQVELNTLDVSFVPQGPRGAELMHTWLASASTMSCAGASRTRMCCFLMLGLRSGSRHPAGQAPPGTMRASRG